MSFWNLLVSKIRRPLICGALSACKPYQPGVDRVGQVRLRYAQYTGVQGIRNRRSMIEKKLAASGATEANDRCLERSLVLEDCAYKEVAAGAMRVSYHREFAQNVLIIQPYIKWGPRRNKDVKPEHQLLEAEALIRSLPNWRIGHSLKVPLMGMQRKSVFGKGKLEELKLLISGMCEMDSSANRAPLTCLFISKSTLSFAQKHFLEDEFNMPVLDRYSVVIQILRLHATSVESKLQVAMAELPYIWSQTRDANMTASTTKGYLLSNMQRDILRARERKLKIELEHVRTHRQLLRRKRTQSDFPIIAVVGYTNAGKTSLIKALTQEQSMQPRDQLFATLDVTAHAGFLPCNLKVIYMDTVGFMSDLPTGLFECFIATLEDAMLADIIIHIQDLAHPSHDSQRRHVEATLESLAKNFDTEEQPAKLPTIINVYNKVDVAGQVPDNLLEASCHLVSAKEETGLRELLFDLERNLLMITGRRKIIMRVKNGGEEMGWLRRNAAIVSMRPDENDSERLLLTVVITDREIQLFKKEFFK